MSEGVLKLGFRRVHRSCLIEESWDSVKSSPGIEESWALTPHLAGLASGQAHAVKLRVGGQGDMVRPHGVKGPSYYFHEGLQRRDGL